MAISKSRSHDLRDECAAGMPYPEESQSDPTALSLGHQEGAC